MDVLNGAIDSLIGSSNREDWTPVALNVADATVTISKEEVSQSPAFKPNFLHSFMCLHLQRPVCVFNCFYQV